MGKEKDKEKDKTWPPSRETGHVEPTPRSRLSQHIAKKVAIAHAREIRENITKGCEEQNYQYFIAVSSSQSSNAESSI